MAQAYLDWFEPEKHRREITVVPPPRNEDSLDQEKHKTENYSQNMCQQNYDRSQTKSRNEKAPKTSQGHWASKYNFKSIVLPKENQSSMNKINTAGDPADKIPRTANRKEYDGFTSICRKQDQDDIQITHLYPIPSFHYLYILDANTYITDIIIGPKTFVRQEHQMVTSTVQKMIVVPPHHYCIIENYVKKDKMGKPVRDKVGQFCLHHGKQEVRLHQDPFPLYPGEILKQPNSPLKIVQENNALRLRAVLDFQDKDGVFRNAGDEWLFEGPSTYIPRVEAVVDETIKSTVISSNEAIHLRARKDFVDKNGKPRVTGEEWLVRTTGAYLPQVFEEVINVINAYTITEKKSLHLRALKTFTDYYGTLRKIGSEWLLTNKVSEAHILDVNEELIQVVHVTSLNSRQFCVILDPVNEKGKNLLGEKKVVKGPKSFFIMPGESLEKGVQNINILGEGDGLIFRALADFNDDGVSRKAGEKWIVKGPREYTPCIQVELVKKTKAIALDEWEGIYVRNNKTGSIKVVRGQAYMLNENEELWEKELPSSIEEILSTENKTKTREDHKKTKNVTKGSRNNSQSGKNRDKTRAVTYQVPHNSAVQIFDFKEKRARVVFGPELVLLEPDEQFTLLNLSGGQPKQPNANKTIRLFLGPDFCTDVITVETSDHAKLSIKMSFSWQFKISDKHGSDAEKIFLVPDFIGDACNVVASRIRGRAAQMTFDDFHKNSAKAINEAVFHSNDNLHTNELWFEKNCLLISSVDIHCVEPLDQRTREALQKSVQLAIEITTNSREASAKHEAACLEQESLGRLERKRIIDDAKAEKARKDLLELQAESSIIESCGQAKAEAQSRSQVVRIESEACVEQAKLKAQALDIETEAELRKLNSMRKAELAYRKKENEIEIDRQAKICRLETEKFKEMVEAIGNNTLLAMSTAAPNLRVRMLKSLGLSSTLITDGSNPVNLMKTASGLIGDVSAFSIKRRKIETKKTSN